LRDGGGLGLLRLSLRRSLPSISLASSNGIPWRAARVRENIFDLPHIFLASEKNKRILHFANSLQEDS